MMLIVLLIMGWLLGVGVQCTFTFAAVSRSIALIFLQVHVHLDNSNQKKKKERTDLWDSSAAKKQGTELTLGFMQKQG